MHPTKQELIERNGLRCMLCGKIVEYKYINWHHIKPKSVCKANHEQIDNSYENGCLLCLDCHAFVHSFDYESEEYKQYMDVIRENRK